MAPSNSETVETVWYRNTEFDTLHEVVKGSDTEKRLRGELRQVGEAEDDVERAYERLSDRDLAAAQKDPSKVPGYVKDTHPALPAAGTVVVQQGEGPSDEDIQARIDAAVAEAVAKATAAKPADPGKQA